MPWTGRMGVTLEAFLAARLAEDEAVARRAAHEGGTWKQEDPKRFPGWISSSDGGRVSFDEGAPDENQAPHIARHDPARVLREVAAGRAILAVVQAIPHSYVEDCYYSCELAVDPGDPEQRAGSGYCNDNAVRTGGCTCGRDVLAARLLGPLAAVYSDHPDYDPDWAVTPPP